MKKISIAITLVLLFPLLSVSSNALCANPLKLFCIFGTSEEPKEETGKTLFNTTKDGWTIEEKDNSTIKITRGPDTVQINSTNVDFPKTLTSQYEASKSKLTTGLKYVVEDQQSASLIINNTFKVLYRVLFNKDISDHYLGEHILLPSEQYTYNTEYLCFIENGNDIDYIPGTIQERNLINKNEMELLVSYTFYKNITFDQNKKQDGFGLNISEGTKITCLDPIEEIPSGAFETWNYNETPSVGQNFTGWTNNRGGTRNGGGTIFDSDSCPVGDDGCFSTNDVTGPGSSDDVNYADNTARFIDSNTKNYTYAFWVNMGTNPCNANFRQWAGQNNAFWLQCDGGGANGIVAVTRTNTFFNSIIADPFIVNQWYAVVAILDRTNDEICTSVDNGTISCISHNGNNLNNLDTEMTLPGAGGDTPPNVTVDEFSVYQFAFTQQNVSDWYCNSNSTCFNSTQEPEPPADNVCTYTSGNFVCDCRTQTVVNVDVDIGNNDFIANGTPGTEISIEAEISNYRFAISRGCKIVCNNNDLCFE